MGESLNICRTCLSEEQEMLCLFTTYIKLKSNQNTLLNFAEMLSSISIQVAANDGLPSNICKPCTKILNLAYIFNQQCQQSELWLHKHFIQNLVPADVGECSSDPLFKVENPVMNLPVNEDNLKTLENRRNVDNVHGLSCEPKLECEQSFEEHYSSNSSKQVNEKHIKTHLKLELPEGFEVCEDSHNKETTLYKCTECHKMFKSKIQLHRHTKSHKLFTCKLCNRSLRSAHGLSYHMKQHQGIKKFICTYKGCNKSFIIKQQLNKHKILHNDEKNYLCSQCGKAYFTADSLNYHLKTHTGDRPHLCTHCGKTFLQACHLTTHMWNHTGIKPYLCSTCGRRYTTGHQLKKHRLKFCGIGNIPSETSARAKKAVKKRKDLIEGK